MAVNNSLANRQWRMGLTAYLTQDAVKDQINKVVGGKNGTRFISCRISPALLAAITPPACRKIIT